MLGQECGAGSDAAEIDAADGDLVEQLVDERGLGAVRSACELAVPIERPEDRGSGGAAIEAVET